jgi:hypothetical protein
LKVKGLSEGVNRGAVSSAKGRDQLGPAWHV